MPHTTSSVIERAIINRLQVAPRSIEELGEEMRANVGQAVRAVASLLRTDEIVKLEGCQVEGGPFYCLPGYVEEPPQIESSELLRSYAIFYEALDSIDRCVEASARERFAAFSTHSALEPRTWIHCSKNSMAGV